jgi:hypothetical protein
VSKYLPKSFGAFYRGCRGGAFEGGAGSQKAVTGQIERYGDKLSDLALSFPV